MISLTGLPIAGKLLDVGGGTGRSSYLLKTYITDIVIADSSMGMLNQARKKSNFVTVCSYSEGLPFKDESFDIVIIVDALHHVKNHKATIDELWRIVKLEGTIVIEEPNIETFSIKLMAIFEKLLLMRSHFLPPTAIKNLFNFSGDGVQIKRDGATAWVVVKKHLK
jgi:demethylmenaquinone methyltransferase/2-methoxy-6-polyprenyl-1,4-benzoquinol methylase